MVLGLLLCVSTLLHYCSGSRVVLSNNGYENVVVAIDESVSRTESEQLITAIKNAFAEASSYIYTATGRRAYFRSVSIVVPSSWPPSDSYSAAVSETFETADVRIGDLDQFDQAFTVRSISLCGQQADYIFATPGRFTNVDLQGNPAGRMLVHQWARYRWGVYDEQPTSPLQLYSFSSHGHFEATRCTAAIQGDIVHSEYGVSCHPTTAGDECGFRPDFGDRTEASVMFYQQMDKITQFCGSSVSLPHNKDAVNDQNVLCNYSSTWDVITRHVEFAAGSNPPTTIRLRSSVLTPTFEVVQPPQYENIVLVLDVSASMQLDGRLERVRNAAYSIIKTVPTGTRVGIVTFNGAAHVNIKLTTVEGEQSQQLLYNALPVTASGTTSIGSGLQAATELWKSSNNGTVHVVGGCSLVVINDGDETAGISVNIDYVFNDVVSSGVRVFPITLVTSGSRSTTVGTFRKLGDLARQTNGYQYLIPDTVSLRQTMLCEAMASVCELVIPWRRKPIQLLQQSVSVPPFQFIRLDMTIDSSSRTSSYFQFSSEKYIDHLTVEVTDPAGSVFDMNSIVEPTGFTIMTLNTDNPKTGVWRARIYSSLPSEPLIVAVSVISHKPTSTATVEEPVTIRADVSERDLSAGIVPILSVSVKKGERGVAKADVVASVVLPSGQAGDWILSDSGANPDYAADDGVYSGYFTNLEKGGEYGVRVRVSGTTRSVTVPPAPYSDTAALYYVDGGRSTYTTDQAQLTGHFSRAISGGMFITSDYQPGDFYPPSRITDLRVANVNHTTSLVTLSWSAPGGNYDRGIVRSYEIKYAENDALALRQNFDAQLSVPLLWIMDDTYLTLRSPGMPGQTENLSITVPQRDNVTYYFAIVSSDDSNLQGPPSPVVGIALLRPQYPVRPEESSGLSTEVLTAIIVVCSLLVAVVGSVALLVCVRRRRQSRADEETMKLNTLEEGSSPGATSTESSRKKKRERRAKKKRLAKEDEEKLAEDVVSQVTDTTYVNVTISEPDLQVQQQQETKEEEQKARESEEINDQKQLEQQAVRQMQERPEQGQPGQLFISESEQAHDHVEHEVLPQTKEQPGQKRQEQQPTADLDPEYEHVQHKTLPHAEQQQLEQTQPQQDHHFHEVENAQTELKGSTQQQLEKTYRQPNTIEMQQEQPPQEIQQGQPPEEIKGEQPFEEMQQERPSQDIQQEQPSEEIQQEKRCEDREGDNNPQELLGKPTEETEMLQQSEANVNTSSTDVEEPKRETQQQLSNVQTHQQQDSQLDDMTPKVGPPRHDGYHEHSTLSAEHGKDGPIPDEVKPSHEDRNVTEQEGEGTSVPNNRTEANTTPQEVTETKAAGHSSASQLELKPTESDTNREHTQSTKPEGTCSLPVPAAAGTVIVSEEDEDSVPALGRLVVLTPKGKTIDMSKKHREDEEKVSPGSPRQSEAGSSIVDQYTVTDSPSRQSLNSAEITAIDEVLVLSDGETSLATTAMNDVEDTKQLKETSSETKDAEVTQNEKPDGNKETVGQNTDSSGH